MAFPRRPAESLLAETGCRCSVCGQVGQVHLHHIVPKKEGGPDEIANAIPVCPNCHSQIHRSGTRRFTPSLLRILRDRSLELGQRPPESAVPQDKMIGGWRDLDRAWLNLESREYQQAKSDLAACVPIMLRSWYVTHSLESLKDLKHAKHFLEGVIEGGAIGADVYLLLGDIEHAFESWEKALQCYRKALDLSSNDRNSFRSRIGIAEMHMNLGRYRTLWRNLRQLLSDPIAGKDVALHARVDNLLGRVAMYLGQYDEAIEILGRSLPEARVIADQWLEASDYHFLGRTYLERGDFANALPMLGKSMRLEEEIGVPVRLAHDLRWIAECYIRLGQVARGKSLLSESFRLFGQCQHRFGMAHVQWHRGKLMLCEGKARGAIDLLEQSSVFWLGAIYARGFASCRYQLAIAYEKEKQYKQSAFAYLDAVDLFRRLRSPIFSGAFQGCQRIRRRLGEREYSRIRRRREPPGPFELNNPQHGEDEPKP